MTINDSQRYFIFHFLCTPCQNNDKQSLVFGNTMPASPWCKSLLTIRTLLKRQIQTIQIQTLLYRSNKILSINNIMFLPECLNHLLGQCFSHITLPHSSSFMKVWENSEKLWKHSPVGYKCSHSFFEFSRTFTSVSAITR